MEDDNQVDGVTKSEINPIYLRGRKFRSFIKEVNVASAGLDETLIPEPLSMIKNLQIDVKTKLRAFA